MSAVQLLADTSENILKSEQYETIHQRWNFDIFRCETCESGIKCQSSKLNFIKGRLGGAKIKPCEEEKKKMFGINFTPPWRIITVDFKHYDIKISAFQPVTAERI